jgi:hypothetical protein
VLLEPVRETLQEELDVLSTLVKKLKSVSLHWFDTFLLMELSPEQADVFNYLR